MNFYSSGDHVVRASQFSSPILIEQGLDPSDVSQCSNQIPRRLTIYLQVFPECELVGPWKRPVLPPSFSTCFIFWTNLLTWPQLRSLSVCHMDGLFYQWGWFCPKILKQLLQQSDIICSRAFAKNPKQTLGNLEIKNLGERLGSWLSGSYDCCVSMRVCIRSSEPTERTGHGHLCLKPQCWG